jgi:tRNA A37 threonylcarbamoyladenosine biosynthesis protein TsaE
MPPKFIKANGMDIKPPKGKAFSYKTEPLLPKAHMITGVFGKRGAGKGVATTHLIKALKFDRLFIISPTFESNSELMNQFDNIDTDDIYSDLDDREIMKKITEKINAERDDLVIWQEQMKEYKKFMKMMTDNIAIIPDEMLLMFYDRMKGQFTPPKHRWGGNNPFIGLWVDDALASPVLTGRKMVNFSLRHRHLGAFEDDRPSIGCSIFFNAQNYRCQGGSIPRSIRNNFTNAIFFKSKDAKELDEISSEMSGEVTKDEFVQAYEVAMADDPDAHPFLFVDLHRKIPEHPSMFRSRFSKFIMLE